MHTISLAQLAGLLFPAVLMVGLCARWGMPAGRSLAGLARMVGQLILVGYVLLAVLNPAQWYFGLLALLVMSFASGWIALGATGAHRRVLLPTALAAIVLGCGAILLWVWAILLHDQPYAPRVIIPLASMAFSNAMNSLSLAAERYLSELRREAVDPHKIAFRAALIPISNSLLAVCLVSLPGMMTGQIIAGVSPLVAARYQITVMLMIFSASALTVWLFLARTHARRLVQVDATA